MIIIWHVCNQENEGPNNYEVLRMDLEDGGAPPLVHVAILARG